MINGRFAKILNCVLLSCVIINSCSFIIECVCCFFCPCLNRQITCKLCILVTTGLKYEMLTDLVDVAFFHSVMLTRLDTGLRHWVSHQWLILQYHLFARCILGVIDKWPCGFRTSTQTFTCNEICVPSILWRQDTGHVEHLFHYW